MSHGGGGSERWLVSYADFITLLMVLFVVLYSMSQVDIERYKQLAGSLRAAFSSGPDRIVDPGIDQSGGVNDAAAAAPIIIPGIPQAPIDSVEVAGQLTDMLAAANLGGSVSVQNNIEGVLISLSEKLLFTPGTAELQAEAYPVLDTIIQMITPLKNDIRIIGHTDDSRPVDPTYKSNWELSVARAIIVAQYFIERKIDPKRLTVSGQGDTKSVFPNDSPEHRAFNSRADIVVVYSVDTDVIHLGIGTSTLGGHALP